MDWKLKLMQFGPIFVLIAMFGGGGLCSYLVLNGIIRARFAVPLYFSILLSVALPVTLYASPFGYGLREVLGLLKKQFKTSKEERKKPEFKKQMQKDFQQAVDSTLPLSSLLVDKKIQNIMKKRKEKKCQKKR